MTAFSLPNDGVTLSLFLTAAATDAENLVVMTDGGVNDYVAELKAGPTMSARYKGTASNVNVAAPAGARFHAYVSIYDAGGGSTKCEISVNGGPITAVTRGVRADATLMNQLTVHPLVESAAIWAHTDSKAALLSAAEITALAGGADPAMIHAAQLVYNSALPPVSAGLEFGAQNHREASVYAYMHASLPAVSFARDELFFNSVYDATGDVFALTAAQSTYLDGLVANGIAMLAELDWNDTGIAQQYELPTSSINRAKFCDYASWYMGQLKAKGVRIIGAELWNEISGTWSGVYKSGVLQTYSQLSPAERDTLADGYVLLATEVKARLAADHPDVLFGVGADVNVNMDWLQRLLDRGILDHCDAIVVHPYSGIDNLDALRSGMDAIKPDVPLWMTEYHGANTLGQLVRYAVQCIAAGATMVTYYSALDGGFGDYLLDASGNQTNYGTAYQYMADLLAGAAYVGETSVGLGATAHELDTASQGRVTVLWGSAEVAISGETDRRSPSGATVAQASSYALSSEPIYVFGSGVSISIVGDVLMGDFRGQFIGTQDTLQGEATWEYGSRDKATGDWTPATWSDVNTRWEMAGIGQFHFIKSSGLHPHPGWLITARVKFSTAKRLHLTGYYQRGASGGDGNYPQITLSDGTLVANGFLSSAGAVVGPFDVVVDVPADVWVEFGLDSGASNTSDFTTMDAKLAETALAPSTLPVNIGPGAAQAGDVLASVTATISGSIVTLKLGPDGTVLWQVP